MGLKVKNEQIIEGNSLVVNTTMTTEQVDFAVMKSGSCVCSRSRVVINMAFLVLRAFYGKISLCAFPSVGRDLEEPGVIEADLR